jgi:Tol biopolymer transport system component
MHAMKLLAIAACSTLLGTPSFSQSAQIMRISVREDGRQIGVPPNTWPMGGSASCVSDDGRFVCTSENYPLGPLVEGLERIHDRVSGAQTHPFVYTGQALVDTWVERVLISGDGNTIVLRSYANNVPGGPTGFNLGALYLIDRPSGLFTHITIPLTGTDPGGQSEPGDITTDGRYVLFTSYADNLVAGDTNQAADVFRYDAVTGTKTRASFGVAGNQSLDYSQARMITDDGRFVLFSFFGDDATAGDNNNSEDVFVRDLQLGTTEAISVTPGGTTGNGLARPVWISADGRYVVFFSDSSNLVAGDTNGWPDHFLRDRQTGTTTLITVTTSGAQTDHYSEQGVMGRGGRYLYFPSFATNVVPGDTNGQEDLFVRDLQLGTTELLSKTPSGAPTPPHTGNLPVYWVRHASADGRFLVFDTGVPTLIDGDSNDGLDGFLLDRQSPGFPVTTYCTAKVHSLGCTPVITSAGYPSAASLDSFHITASQVRPNTRGLLLWSLTPAATPFGGGTLCLGAPTQTGAVVASGSYGGTSGPCDLGQFAYHMSQSFLATNALASGTTAYAQFLARDNGFAPPNNVALTDAIRFTVAP